MLSLTLIYVYLLTWKFTKSEMEQSETLYWKSPPENDYWNHGPVYVPGLEEVRTPDIFSSFFASTIGSSNLRTDTETNDYSETTTPELSVADFSDTISTIHTPATEPASSTITTAYQPKIMSVATEAASITMETTLDTEKIKEIEPTPSIALQTIQTLSSKELDSTLEYHTPSIFFNPTKSSTIKKLPATTDAYQDPTILVEPFSMFLKKLLIFLCVKRSSDLRKLIEAFMAYVRELVTAAKLDVLGPETNTYIADVIISLNDSTIYTMRNYFGEMQLMLVNRDKDSDDLLASMDDMYEVFEEEAMQTVLNDTIMYPNSNKTARRIARGFVNNVFLKPMNRVARTKRGEQLFSWITETVKSRNSYKITKQILRQKNYLKKSKATTEYIDLQKNDNIYSNSYHKRIRNNIQGIENMLREGDMSDDEEDLTSISMNEKEGYDISNKNDGYKTITGSEDLNEESGESGKDNSNEKQADDDGYEPMDEPNSELKPHGNYELKRNKLPIIVDMHEKNDQNHRQIKPGYQKVKSNKAVAKLKPNLDNEKPLELPHQPLRVRLTNYNPNTQNKNIIGINHEIENTFNKSKVYVAHLQKRYKILKTDIKSQVEEYLNKKRKLPGESKKKTHLLWNDETENGDKRQIYNDMQEPTSKLYRELEPKELHNKLSLMNKKYEGSGPFHHKVISRPQNIKTNKAPAKIAPYIYDFNYQMRSKEPYQARKERIKNYNTNTQYKNTLQIKYTKDNILRKNKINITKVRKKINILPKKYESQEYLERKTMENNNTSIVWSGEHSSEDSELEQSHSSKLRDSEQSSDLADYGTTPKKAKQVINDINVFMADHDGDGLRFKNDNPQKLPDKYRLTTRYRGEESKALDYRLKTTPNKTLEFYRRNYQKAYSDRYRGTTKGKIPNIFKATEHKDEEMTQNKNLHDFFRHMDFINYNATRRSPIHVSTSLLHLQDDSHEIDEEDVLKRNIYKAMKKLLKK